MRHDEAVTRDLVSEWGPSAESLLRAFLTEGMAGWTGRVAWTDEHVQGICDCVYRVTTRFIDEHVTCDVTDDVKTAIQRICERVLFKALDEHQDRQTRDLIHGAEVELLD